MSTADDWTARAATLRDELVTAGKLTSPEWQSALLAVPRHEFVPEFYERGTEPGRVSWELVSASSADTRERWWNGVWANTSLVTWRVGRPTGWRAVSTAATPRSCPCALRPSTPKSRHDPPATATTRSGEPPH